MVRILILLPLLSTLLFSCGIHKKKTKVVEVEKIEAEIKPENKGYSVSNTLDGKVLQKSKQTPVVVKPGAKVEKQVITKKEAKIKQ